MPDARYPADIRRFAPAAASVIALAACASPPQPDSTMPTPDDATRVATIHELWDFADPAGSEARLERIEALAVEQ